MKKAPAPTKTQGAIEQLELFDIWTFCPIFPSRGTLLHQALLMLMNGDLIDHPDFEERTKSWRLGNVVFRLRALNWPIEAISIPSPTDCNPSRIIAVYRLDPRCIKQVKAMNLMGCAENEQV